MTPETVGFIGAAVVLGIMILLAVIRLVKGPGAADRVVALDTVNTIVVGMMIALSAAFKTLIYVDVAIVYALLSFASTVFIARYLGGGE